MRLLRVIVTSLALLAGLIGAAVVMAMGFVLYLLLRLLGRPASRPQFHRGPPRVRPAYSAKNDVIDITATNVKD